MLHIPQNDCTNPNILTKKSRDDVYALTDARRESILDEIAFYTNIVRYTCNYSFRKDRSTHTIALYLHRQSIRMIEVRYINQGV